MGKKEVDASFIEYCKDHKFSAHRVAILMKKKGFSENQIFEVYKKLYDGEPIKRRNPRRAAQRAVKEHLERRSSETKKMLALIKNNQYYLSLFAFMLLGFFFSTLYILTAFMGNVFGILLIFGVGYLNGILVYNVFKMFGAKFKRQLLAVMLAPFIGLSFIAATGFFFSALRSFLINLINLHGYSIASANLVLRVSLPLNPIFAMFLFYIGYNIHTLVKLTEHKPQQDFMLYVLSIPLFLFALVIGWGIFHIFLKNLVIKNVFG